MDQDFPTLRYDWVGPWGPLPNGLSASALRHYLEFGNYVELSWEIVRDLSVCNSHLRWIASLAGYSLAELPVVAPPGEEDNGAYMLEPFGDPARYLGLFDDPPFNQSAFSLMSPLAKNLLRKNRMHLLINYSQEGGSPESFHFKALHEQLRAEDLPIQNVRFVSSNLNLDAQYAEWCKKTGEPGGLHIVSWPYARYLTKYLFLEQRSDSRSFVQDDEDKSGPRAKHFLCFNRRPHAARVAIASFLLGAGLDRFGFLSFPADSQDIDGERVSYRSFEEMFGPTHSRYSELSAGFAELLRRAPLTIDLDPSKHREVFATAPADLYRQSFFSIITETLFFESRQQMLTEKTFKAIANFHPFIIVSTPGLLARLRSLGFRTFSPLIDEAYDDIVDPAERLDAILDEIKRLCSMSLSEMRDWYRELLPSLQHNYRLFYAPSGNQDLEKIFRFRSISSN